MKVEDIAVMALSRAAEFSQKVPSARSVMYRRIGIRQQQLYTRAAKINPDWAGTMGTAALVAWNGLRAIDLADLVTCSADLITRIEIFDKGASAYANGQEVNIVTLADPGAADAPRVVIRDRIVQAYNSELDGVTSLAIHFSKVPLAIAPTDGNADVELQEPHAELLVIDLTRHLLQKTIVLAASERTAAIASLDAEEGPALAAFDEHVRSYSDATVARFGGRRFAPVEQ